LVPSLQKLLAALRRLPGVGPKSAQRIGYHLLRADREEAAELARAVVALKDRVGLCSVCGNVAERAPEAAEGTPLVCPVCTDPRRDSSRLLIVEEPYNVEAFQKTGVYDGLYHVLGGLFDPLAGVGAVELGLDALVKRVSGGGFREVILATSPTTAGEATASYLHELLKPFGVTLTRIAVGLAPGADVDYADEVSLRLALEGRREYGSAGR
jgi:recombination protein RecR